MPETLYGIIGWPLAQTLSPLIHNLAFKKLELPAVYLAWPVAPANLAAFMAALPFYKVSGCSVTIPHKIAILSYLDSISESAELARAVNTLFWRDGKLCGDNTDVAGFLAPLINLERKFKTVLLLGAGGAAHAVAAGLTILNCKNTIITSPGNTHQFELAEKFSFSAIDWQDRYKVDAELVINATPLGMKGKFAEESPYDFRFFPAKQPGLAYDLVYNPLKTHFLEDAERHGWQCINGLKMFYAQGNAQFRIWTGKDLPEECRQTLEKALI